MAFKWIIIVCIPFTLFAEVGYVEPWGTDAAHILATKESKTTLSSMGGMAEKIILFYRNFLTQTTGPRSHFRPSSSEYMLEAIRAFGFIRGYLMGCDRLLRENGEDWLYHSTVDEKKLYKWDPPSPLKQK